MDKITSQNVIAKGWDENQLVRSGPRVKEI